MEEDKSLSDYGLTATIAKAQQPAEVGPAVHWGVACDACPGGSSNLLGSRYKKVGGISAATRTLVFPPASD